jgi:BppU N-terminal domain
MLFQLKRTDDKQSLPYIIQNEDGTIPSLEGAKVQFIMGKKNRIVINKPAIISSALDGQVQYDFESEDTIIAGNYMAEFVVEFPTGERQTFPTRGYINVNIEANLDASQTNIIIDYVAERQGEFTKKLESILLQAGNITMSSVNEYSWTSTEGQLTYEMPTNSRYDPSSKWFFVYVGGIAVDPSLIDRRNENSFTLLIEPSLVPAGINVMAKWTEPLIPLTNEETNSLKEEVSSLGQDIQTLASSVEKKVESTNIKSIRDNTNVFEYSLDGTIWKPVQGGSGGSPIPNVKYLSDYSSYVSGSNWVPAFNQAFTDLTASGGGVLRVHAGTFTINSTLTIPTGVNIIGVGEGVSIIRLASGVNADMVTFDVNDNCGISFLTLWGNGDNVAGTSTTYAGLVIGRAGLSAVTNEGSMPNLSIHDLEIRSVNGNGMLIHTNTWVYLLTRITIRYCLGYGMWVQSTDNVYSVMYIHSNALAGIYATGHNNRFSDMKIIFNGRGTLSSGSFYGNGTDLNSAGIYCTGRRNTFVNIESQENYGHGFVFDGARECDLIGLLSDKNGYTALAPGGTSITGPVTAIGFYFMNSARQITGIVKSTNFNEGLVSQRVGYYIDSTCSNISLDYEQDLTQTGRSDNLSLSSVVVTAAMKTDTHAFAQSNYFLESGQALTNAITAYDGVNFALETGFVNAGYTITGNEITNVNTNWAGTSARIGTKKDISVTAGNLYLVRVKVKPTSGSYNFRFKAIYNEGTYATIKQQDVTAQAGVYSDISFVIRPDTTSTKLLVFVDDKAVNSTQQSFSISELAIIDITNAVNAGYTGKSLDRVVKKNYFLGSRTFV